MRSTRYTYKLNVLEKSNTQKWHIFFNNLKNIIFHYVGFIFTYTKNKIQCHTIKMT